MNQQPERGEKIPNCWSELHRYFELDIEPGVVWGKKFAHFSFRSIFGIHFKVISLIQDPGYGCHGGRESGSLEVRLQQHLLSVIQSNRIDTKHVPQLCSNPPPSLPPSPGFVRMYARGKTNVQVLIENDDSGQQQQKIRSIVVVLSPSVVTFFEDANHTPYSLVVVVGNTHVR